MEQATKELSAPNDRRRNSAISHRSTSKCTCDTVDNRCCGQKRIQRSGNRYRLSFGNVYNLKRLADVEELSRGMVHRLYSYHQYTHTTHTTQHTHKTHAHARTPNIFEFTVFKKSSTQPRKNAKQTI